MIRIAVCDDDANYLARHAEIIKQKFKSAAQDKTIDVRMFLTGDAFLEEHIAEPFDIVFLDIDLPGIDGFDVSVEFRAHNPFGIIIFVSNYYNKVYRAQRYKFLYFMRKGYFNEDIDYVTDICLQNIHFLTAPYTFEHNRKVYTVPKQSIMLIKSSLTKNNIVIVTRNGDEYKQRLTIAKAASGDFADKPFIQINRSCIVNMHHVIRIKNDCMFMANLDEIPISDSRKNFVFTAWREFCDSISAA